MTTEFTRVGVMAALREGPYGRCVYECDNDVVDHQVVNLLYDNGVTASFTMVGQSEYRDRQTIIFGTKGELRGNGEKIIHYDFLTGKTQEIAIEQPQTGLQGHGGGDYNLIQKFVEAVATRDPSGILSGPVESLETHLTTFAAERARLENRVVEITVSG
jgi:predicted dehydrogenase